MANGGEIVQPIGADAPEITEPFRDPSGNVLGLYQEPVGSGRVEGRPQKQRKNPRDAGDDGPFRGVTESAMRADAGAAEFEDEIGDHGKVDEEQDELADRGSVKEFVDFER